MNRKPNSWHACAVGLLLSVSTGAMAQVAGEQPPPSPEMLARGIAIPAVEFARLDTEQLAREDAIADEAGVGPRRFAIPHRVSLTPTNAGEWSELDDGTSMWRLRVLASEAVHLNFGFSRFALPEGAELRIATPDGRYALGPFTRADQLPHAQLWTQVIPGDTALLILTVPAAAIQRVELELGSVNQGYRGFGFRSAICKSGACNMDVACLGASDPWNQPRRAVARITIGGTGLCTGSLLNNTSANRRMLFATARHCGVTDNAGAASVLAYWNYEAPSCRSPRPGAGVTDPPFPPPNTTTPGQTFLATTNSPFSGGGAANTRSDFTLIELATPAPNNPFNLFWAGWNRNAPPTTCFDSGNPFSTFGLCASIHHPDGDEKRITFVEENMIMDNISSAQDVHWRANWDPDPPIVTNIPAPQPPTLPPGVTEPGSSGSPLYDMNQRLVGVLSGGPSACGATGASLRDQYGGLFHAWDGLGTAATRMRDHLDPLGTNPFTIDGVNAVVPNPDVIFANSFE